MSRRLPVALCLLLAASSQAETRLAIRDGRWSVNDRPTHPGSPAEGLLMNVRMVNATFEDRNRPAFAPEANTDRFIARIPDYAARGVDAFTLCLQGGMPGYEGARNSAFEPDGSLRPACLARVGRVIRACDAHGVAVILGLFYQRQSGILRDGDAVRTGVVNAVRWVRDEGFRNVAVEIANEYPHSGFKHRVIRDPAGMAGLIRLARQTAPGLAVSASGYGDGRLHAEVADAADFLLVHWNGTKIEDLPARLDALRRHGKPIVCNEDDRTGAEAVAALRASVAHGAGYGLMLKERNQTFPFRFEGPADDPVYYAALREVTSGGSTGAATHAAGADGAYFSPSDPEGGWRRLERPADARSKPGSGGQIVAFVPGLDLVAARQTGAGGPWKYEEFLRRPCAAVADWPPEHLKGLPPDRLDRMRDTLAATAGNGLARLNGDHAGENDTILRVRAGIGALVLRQREDELNRYFESAKFVWPANPKFGFSLFSTDCMRLYGLLNRRTGAIPGRLSPAAQDNIERQMWAVAKANSRIDEARRSVRDLEGSENHHLSSKVCDLLAAQFLRKIPAFAGRRYDDGSTLDAQYEARRSYFMDWLDDRARYGQFVEAGSPSYQPDTINALFNLRDFAEDPVLRRKAEMFLDLAYANMAEETLLTTRGGPKSRVKTGHEYNEGMCDRGYDLLFDAPGRTFAPLADNYRTTSDYLPPPAVVALARDTGGRGAYAFAKRWPGPLAARRRLDGAEKWRTLDPQKTVLRQGFATPDYVLGSAAVDPSWLDDLGMGFRWQGVVFAGDTLARIGFEVQPARDKDWHGFNPFFSLQDRNILITQKWAPVPPNPATANPAHLRVYFSPTLDEVTDEGGWIFARDAGAFAAVKIVSGGYAWKPAWKHADRIANDNRSFVVTDSEDSPVILVVNRTADYAGDFVAFRAALKAEPVRLTDGALHFATMEFRGPSHPGRIGGRVVDLAPALGYDSPFIRSEWGSGLIRIRKGEDTVVLDFRDPRNPAKTVGAAVTEAFPPGVGNAEPIVFGASR